MAATRECANSISRCISHDDDRERESDVAAVTLCLFVPRSAISNTDTRYCDQCCWPIWNTIRMPGKTCENLSRREIDYGGCVSTTQEPLYHSRSGVARSTSSRAYTWGTRVFNFFPFPPAELIRAGQIHFPFPPSYVITSRGKHRDEWGLNKKCNLPRRARLFRFCL